MEIVARRPLRFFHLTFRPQGTILAVLHPDNEPYQNAVLWLLSHRLNNKLRSAEQRSVWITEYETELRLTKRENQHWLEVDADVLYRQPVGEMDRLPSDDDLAAMPVNQHLEAAGFFVNKYSLFRLLGEPIKELETP